MMGFKDLMLVGFFLTIGLRGIPSLPDLGIAVFLVALIPVKVALESSARADVDVGGLAYWPSGPAFCIFFGPTPVSTSEQPRAYSPVNVFGRVLGNPQLFKSVANGTVIKITAAEV